MSDFLTLAPRVLIFDQNGKLIDLSADLVSGQCETVVNGGAGAGQFEFPRKFNDYGTITHDCEIQVYLYDNLTKPWYTGRVMEIDTKTTATRGTVLFLTEGYHSALNDAICTFSINPGLQPDGENNGQIDFGDSSGSPPGFIPWLLGTYLADGFTFSPMPVAGENVGGMEVDHQGLGDTLDQAVKCVLDDDGSNWEWYCDGKAPVVTQTSGAITGPDGSGNYTIPVVDGSKIFNEDVLFVAGAGNSINGLVVSGGGTNSLVCFPLDTNGAPDSIPVNAAVYSLQVNVLVQPVSVNEANPISLDWESDFTEYELRTSYRDIHNMLALYGGQDPTTNEQIWSPYQDSVSIAVYGVRQIEVSESTLTAQSQLDEYATAYFAINAFPTFTGTSRIRQATSQLRAGFWIQVFEGTPQTGGLGTLRTMRLGKVSLAWTKTRMEQTIEPTAPIPYIDKAVFDSANGMQAYFGRVNSHPKTVSMDQLAVVVSGGGLTH